MITLRTYLMAAAAGFSVPFLLTSCENKAAKAAAEAELAALRKDNDQLNEQLAAIKKEQAEKKKLLALKSLDKKIVEMEAELAVVSAYNEQLRQAAAGYDAAIAQWKEPIRLAIEGMTLDSLQLKGGKFITGATVKQIKDGAITFISGGQEQTEKLEDLEASTLIQLMNEKAIMDQITVY